MPCLVQPIAVVPVLVGPLQVLLALLPGLLAALAAGVWALLKPSALKGALRLMWRLKFALLPVAAVIAGAVYVLPIVLRQHHAVGTAEAGTADWPMFRAGPARLGAADGLPGPRQGGQNWCFDEAKTFYSSPTVVGNRVYVTSADKGIYRDSGAIYCLDADTGGVVWKVQPDGFRATFSSPAVSGKYLVCGEGLHYTRDARIFCLDVSAEGRGRVLWQYRTASHVESSPCIEGGRVYVGAGDDGYYCFELEPDAAGAPRMVWHAPGAQFPDAETPPVVADGRVFVGLGMEGNAVCCLDAATGREVWRLATPYPVMSPATVAGGRVFVGMGNGNFIQTAEEVAQEELRKLRASGADQATLAEAARRLEPAGEVWGIDVADPARRWSFKLPRTVLGAVAATADALYFGSWDGRLYRLSYDGKETGRWDAGAPIVVSPAVTQDTVYFVTGSGTLHALTRDGLDPVWAVELGGEGVYLSSPAVARGHVYVGTEGRGLLCMGEPGGRGGQVATESPLPDRGAMLWGYPARAAEPVQVRAAVAAYGEDLYVPLAGGARTGLACLSNPQGAREAPPERWFFATPNGVRLAPAADERVVLCADGAPGDAGRRLYALDPRTGAEVWRHPIAPDASGEFALYEDAVCVQSGVGVLTCLDLAGAVQWESPVGPLAGVPARVGSILVAAVRSPAALVALDAVCGRTLYRVALDAAPTTAPAVRKKTVYLGTASGLEARSLLDGALLWRAASAAVAGALAVGADRIAYVDASSTLVLVDRQSGAVLAHVPDASPAVPPLLTRAAVFFATAGSIERYLISDGTRERWMDTSWLGAISSPLVAVQSRVYFATQDRGLVRAGRWQ